MKNQKSNRRSFLGQACQLSPLFLAPGLMAEQLTITPRQTPGPFYPDKLPLDTDNDLILINDSLTPSVGTITYLGGRVTDTKGNPLRHATVELWQVDGNGVYLHSRGGNRKKLDSNFQGYGRFLTDSQGRYFFRTIKPNAYPGRAPHIHMSVSSKGLKKFTTQCYVKGEPQNKRDFILNSVKDMNARNSLVIPFDPLPGSKLGELAANFDIVLGRTPEN